MSLIMSTCCGNLLLLNICCEIIRTFWINSFKWLEFAFSLFLLSVFSKQKLFFFLNCLINSVNHPLIRAANVKFTNPSVLKSSNNEFKINLSTGFLNIANHKRRTKAKWRICYLFHLFIKHIELLVSYIQLCLLPLPSAFYIKCLFKLHMN